MVNREGPLADVVESFWKGKRVFLTGHTGFKGSWLALWLQKMGAVVCGYALAPEPGPSLFVDADLARGMESIIGDIRDLEKFAGRLRSFKPDIVIHMAAQAFVRDMRAFFKASGQLLQDEIAAKQVWLLKQHLPRGTKLRTSDVKELFLQMRDGFS